MQRVVDAGRVAGIEIVPRTFQVETRTAEDAARNVGCDVAQIVKSLVFGSEGGPVLFLIAGNNKLDTRKGASVAHVEKLERVDAGTARSATGYSIGATPPVGLVTDLPVFMDEELLRHDVVWAAAGRPDSVFPCGPHDLQRASRAIVADLKID